MESSIILLWSSFVVFLNCYMVLLFFRLALTWFLSIDWYKQPFYALSRLTDPYLRIFKGITPSFLGFDSSGILGLLTLQSILQIVSNVGFSVH